VTKGSWALVIPQQYRYRGTTKEMV